jgi:hypothetical protein
MSHPPFVVGKESPNERKEEHGDDVGPVAIAVGSVTAAIALGAWVASPQIF